MDGGDDLISTLPDCLLGEIVTRLPTDDAIRVQVLSTRWRHIWHSSPLNLDLLLTDYYDYNRIVPSILAAHPGPSRCLKVEYPYNRREFGNSWLRSPALSGLQELEIEPGYQGRRNFKTTLSEQALFQFAPTLRVLRIGYHTFPSEAAVAALPLPHLELISFCCVDILEDTLHVVLAACPVLRTLVLNGCTGFTTVRINSPSIISLAISPADSSTITYYPWYDHYYETQRVKMVRATTSQVIIQDAPFLEKLLVPCRGCSDTTESLQLLRVDSASRLRVLGFLSSTIPKLQISGIVFKHTTRRVNHVRPDNVIKEKRLLMQAVGLGSTLRSVKILALKDVDSVGVLTNFLKCFPFLDKLYISLSSSASRGFRSAASYDKQNPIMCLENHLKMVALDGYDGKRTHVKFAKFFVRNAHLLELMKFRIFRNYHREPRTTKDWIADQQRQLNGRSIASGHVKFHFVHDARYYQDVYYGEDMSELSEHIHDSSRNDPFDQWFELENDGLG